MKLKNKVENLRNAGKNKRKLDDLVADVEAMRKLVTGDWSKRKLDAILSKVAD